MEMLDSSRSYRPLDALFTSRTLALLLGLLVAMLGKSVAYSQTNFHFQDDSDLIQSPELARPVPNSVPLVCQLGDVPPAPRLTFFQNNEAGLLRARVESLEEQLQSILIEQFAPNLAACDGIEFYAGAAAVWAKPHFKEAFQYSQTNVATGQQTLFPFEYDYKATPRVWLGLKNREGLGVRATYWNFEESGRSSSNSYDGTNIYGAHAVTIIFPANIFSRSFLTTLNTSNELKTETFDLHGTLDTRFNGIDVSLGAGIRYAKLQQSYSAVVEGLINPQSTLDWKRQFDGIGPSLAFSGKRPIRNTPLSVVASGGGALLFGTKTIDRTVTGDQSPQPASPFLSLRDADEVVGIGELSLGVEWATVLSNGTVLTIRNSYESQLWAESGAPTLGFLGFEGFGFGFELSR